jgi:hypothetical protein
LCAASTITISASTVAPMAMGDAAQRHDRRRHPEQPHGDERREHREGQGDDGQQRAAEVQQKERDDRGHDDHLLGERAPQRVDGAVDERRAVVGRDHLDPRRQGVAQPREARAHALDDLARVGPVGHHHDPRDHLALAVELGHPAPRRGRQGHPPHVAHSHRAGLGAGAHQGHLEVLGAGHEAPGAHEVLALRHLQGAPAHLAVGPRAPPRRRRPG